MYLRTILAIFTALCGWCHCYNEIYKGQQVWKVDARTDADVANLKRLLHDPMIMVERHKFPSNREGNVVFRVGQENFKDVQTLLESFELTPQLLVRDVKELLDLESYRDRRWRYKRSLTSLEDFDYTRYHSLDEIEKWMDMLAAQYEFIKKFPIGVSFENRTLSGLKIALNDRRNKPVFYIDAATHAREWIAPATLMYIVNQILPNASCSRLLEELDFYFVPVVNVDGYAYTWSHARLWRKTRRPPPDDWRKNNKYRLEHPLCFGVDANRNWDVNFGGQGSDGDPCSILYRGPCAESEPVIHNLANFLREERSRIKALVSLHNFGQQILYPYNYNLTKAAPTEAELNMTGHRMAAAMERVHGMKYEPGRGAVVLYVFSGSTSDWAYEKAGIDFSYTIELRDTGTFEFELPADQIIPNGQEVMAGIEVLANEVIKKFGRKKAT